jgi:hypothetical protein
LRGNSRLRKREPHSIKLGPSPAQGLLAAAALAPGRGARPSPIPTPPPNFARRAGEGLAGRGLFACCGMLGRVGGTDRRVVPYDWSGEQRGQAFSWLPNTARLRRQHAQPRLLTGPGARGRYPPTSPRAHSDLTTLTVRRPAPAPRRSRRRACAGDLPDPPPASDPTEPETVPDLEADRTMPHLCRALRNRHAQSVDAELARSRIPSGYADFCIRDPGNPPPSTRNAAGAWHGVRASRRLAGGRVCTLVCMLASREGAKWPIRRSHPFRTFPRRPAKNRRIRG